MDFKLFIEKLDKNNLYYSDVVLCFERDHEQGLVIIEKKGRDLVEVVERCKAQRLFPVVDKKLGLVFGCDTHGLPRQELFRYHYYAGGADRPYVDPDASQDRYISEGHGWFISKMRPKILIAGMSYREDQFDKDVFIMHKVEHQEPDPLEEIRRLQQRRW